MYGHIIIIIIIIISPAADENRPEEKTKFLKTAYRPRTSRYSKLIYKV